MYDLEIIAKGAIRTIASTRAHPHERKLTSLVRIQQMVNELIYEIELDIQSDDLDLYMDWGSHPDV